MKKLKLAVIVIFAIVSTVPVLGEGQPQPTQAIQPSAEWCRSWVSGELEGMKFLEKNTGKKQYLNGLSIADIERIEATKGACAAKDAINEQVVD